MDNPEDANFDSRVSNKKKNDLADWNKNVQSFEYTGTAQPTSKWYGEMLT